MYRLILLGVLGAWLVAGGTALAQEPAPPAPAAPATPAADPADVESIDAIIAALYDVISGPAGERNWDRLRSLFLGSGGILVPAMPRPAGAPAVRILTVEDYIELAGGFFRDSPFYEIETGRRLERFGNVANAMSGYESRRDPAQEPFSSGVNSITLVTDGTRWYVVAVAWDIAREGNEIPADLAGNP